MPACEPRGRTTSGASIARAADVRAPTPSAAAELIVPDTVELQRQLAAMRQGLDRRLSERIASARERLFGFARTALMREPLRRLLDARQRLDQTEDTLRRAALLELFRRRGRLEEKALRLRPAGLQDVLRTRGETLQARRAQLGKAIRQGWDDARRRLQEAGNLLRILGPQGTLERGYSITTLPDGRVIGSVEQCPDAATISTRLVDGTLTSVVMRRQGRT